MRIVRSISVVVLCFTVLSGVAVAQEALATAKALYQSAAYDEALGLLDRLKSNSAPASEVQTVAQYRAYCLLALNRQADAEVAIEDVVKADLFFMPSDRDVSPRVRTTFQRVRQRLLPAAARSEYAKAKATFDRKEFGAAADQFARLNALLRDPLLDGVAGMADLRELGAGFYDLAQAAAVAATTTAEATQPPAPPIPPPPPAPAAPPIYDLSVPGITQPAIERQDVPNYRVGRDMPMNRLAVIDLIIDEMGRVEKAEIRQSIDVRYDALLLEAATRWRYKPALTRDGRPVKFFKRLQVTIK